MPEYIWKLNDLKKVPKNGYKVFSCFACGGGSSMGYKLAGYEVIGDCEIDDKINAMYLKNFTPRYNFKMGVQDMVKLENLPEELFNLDVLDGSPPCSTFSVAGDREKNWGKKKMFREGQAKQVLDDLFFEFIKLADRLKPKVVIAENVKGMLVGNAKGYINMIAKKFDEAGYTTQLFLLNAATMGVPQRRERVFFICTRKDLNLPKIHLNFHERPILYNEYKDSNYVPIKKDTRAYRMWLKRIPSDNSMEDTIYRIEGKKNQSFNTKYIKGNETPRTQTGRKTNLRYDVPGYMSDRDILITQTFPIDYDTNGQDTHYVCGMSVPPIMMKRVAEQVKVQLLDKEVKNV